MDNWRVVEIVLGSVLIGAVLPVLFQLRSTLKSIATTLESLTPRGNRLLQDIDAVVTRANRVTAELEAGGRVERFLQAVDGLAKSVEDLRGGVGLAMHVGSAVGPAIAAAVRAMRTPASPVESAQLDHVPTPQGTSNQEQPHG